MHTLTMHGAVDAILDGKVLAFPTETFYGLGCDARNQQAVDRIFFLKGRAADKPLPLLVGDKSQLGMVVRELSSAAAKLAALFWPGPLTLLLPGVAGLPMGVTGPDGLVAVRVSSHPGAAALSLQAQAPLAATSANISGRPPVTTAADLDPNLIQRCAGVLVHPPEPAGGAPSTIIHPAPDDTLHVLREGAISPARLAATGFAVSQKF